MDFQSLVQYKKTKRRERAARMAEEPVSLLDDLDSAEEDTDLLKLKPQRPPRPKKVQERLKDPIYEEDIVEGFSFCSFMTYEDLDKMAKWSSQHNGKFPDPYSKIKLDEEKKVKKKKKKKDKDRDSILKQIDPNTNKGSSGSSSERGYICDSDSDGDKGSDTGVGDLFRARKLSNACQNGLSPNATVKSEPGLNVPLPAVPLPESVARNLNHGPSSAVQVPVTTVAGAIGPAPAPKPLYRPFALSPPPSSTSATPTPSSTVTPSTLPTAAASAPLPPPHHHPAYRPNPAAGQHPQNPFFPYPYPSSAATSALTSGITSGSALNGSLYPPPRTTSPASNTNTVASSHHDLTCKSHLPKLAHALTTTTSSRPLGASLPASGLSLPQPNKSNYPSLPLNDPANLRRELDHHRYLAGSHENRNLAGTLGPHPPPQPPLFGSNPLASPIGLGLPPTTQQSPNSFLASSLTKDNAPKMGGPNSLFAGLGNPPGFPGISPMGATPPDPLRKSSTSTSLSSPLLVPPSAASSSSTSSQGPKKTGKWNAMHVRIAWEIYNHQQKQKGSDKKDNPLVPSTSSSLAPAAAKSTSVSGVPVAHPPLPTKVEPPPSLPPGATVSAQIGQKRPAPGAPPQSFMHKRPTTDADLLRSQLFHPPRPPNPLDPLNPLLPRPPYMPPFGPSPLQSALSFPRFGGSASPFGGLGSLSDSSSPLSGYAGLASSLNAVSSSHDPFGLARPGFPPLFSSPSSSLTSPGWPSPHQRPLETKPKLPVPPSHHQLGLNTSKDKLRPPLESPSRNGGPTNLTKTNGDSNSATSSPLRPASTSSSPLVKNNDYKKDDSNEITVVGEKLNHVPNGGLTDPNRPSSSHSVHSVHSGKYRDLGPAAGGPLGALTSSVKPPSDSKTLAASLARPPVTSSSLNHPFGLASLYSGLGGPAPPPATPAPPPPGLPGLPNPYSDPYRSLGLNPYYAAGASRESLLRLNQLMMTDTERMRMGLTAAAGYPPPTPPGLYPPNSALLGGAKPPTLPGHHPSLGYPPPPPVMPGFGAVSAPSLGLPPLNGHAPGLPGAGSSSSHHHPLR